LSYKETRCEEKQNKAIKKLIESHKEDERYFQNEISEFFVRGQQSFNHSKTVV